MVEIMCDDVLLHISSQFCAQLCHNDSLKESMVGVFTPRKLASATNQDKTFCFWKAVY